MSLFKMLTAEITHHWNNFILTLTAIIVAATLFVAGPTLIDGYANDTSKKIEEYKKQTDTQLTNLKLESEKELKALDKKTKRKMRDLGYNLRIIHKDTDYPKLLSDFEAVDMPEAYLQQLAKSSVLTKVVHLVGRLYQMIPWEDRKALIVGLAPEVTQTHLEKKSDMQRYQVKPGHVRVGSGIAAGLEVGKTIVILKKEFIIEAIQKQQGSREDIILALNLKDAQELLGKEGKITEIRALGCKCATTERLEEIIPQLQKALPDVKVFELTIQAKARDEQRKIVVDAKKSVMKSHKKSRDEMLANISSHRDDTEATMAILTKAITPLVLLVCAIWVGLLVWANVRQRRSEIGLLRALGKNTGSIALLFLGKALLMGIVGGAFGCLLGFLLAKNIAVTSLDVASQNFSASWQILAAALFGAPLICMLAGYLPTLMAIRQDPAIVLQDD